MNFAFLISVNSLRWGPHFLVALGLLGLALVACWGALNYFLRQSLPRTRGEISVKGIRGRVTIRRDGYGVPTIEAQTLKDVLFGQGFVHAQDRLWQMELNRRVGAGRLAEIFGEQVLPADVFLRRLGLARAAQADFEAMTPEEHQLLEAYCAGVNAGVESLTHLPVEFRLLKLHPELWKPLDSLTWIQVMSMDLCSNWEQELLRGRLLHKLGVEGAELLHLFTKEGAQTLPPASRGQNVLEGLWDLYEQAREYLPNGGLPGGSNAWVVAGKRTVSGRPILANDPHLIGRVPSIWHEASLKAGKLDVRGACFPGVPFVVIGSNQKVAWGITNSYADTQDLFLERFLDEDRYETEDGPREVEKITESIPVKGREAHEEVMIYTRHGPVLFKDGEDALALQWVNFQGSRPVATLMRMNLATETSEFKEALRTWQAPSSNFVFADVHGNIGYLMAGQVPIRKKGCGLTPTPGWTGEYEWTGYIPFEELPQVENPDCGYVVTANNPVVGPDFPYHISWDWMNPVRAHRIEEMLLFTESVDMEYCRAMQVDVHCETGLRFARYCAGLELRGEGPCKARELLSEWDGDGKPESCGMAIYQMTMLTTILEFLTPLLGEELCRQFLGQSSNPLTVLAGHTGRYTVWFVQLLESPENLARLYELWPELPPVEELIEKNLGLVHDYLLAEHGPNPYFWQWGFLHRLQFKHALGGNALLGKIFNGPMVNAGGDTDTVFQTAVNPNAPYRADAWCPSFRQVVELGPEIRYASVIPTGQSGHPASRNYMNQFLLWGEGFMRPESDVSERVLHLHPG